MTDAEKVKQLEEEVRQLEEQMQHATIQMREMRRLARAAINQGANLIKVGAYLRDIDTTGSDWLKDD